MVEILSISLSTLTDYSTEFLLSDKPSEFLFSKENNDIGISI